jgi:nucleotide-binding universal stress UspA family protein
MQRFKNIMVVVDEFETAAGPIEAAADLAKRNGARLAVIGLVDLGGANHLISLYDGTQVDVEGLLAEERRAALEQATAHLDVPEVSIDVLGGVGFVEIIKRIQRNGHDIVFCAPPSESSRGLAGASLVMHLLRKSPVPVWVETPRGDPSPDVAVAVGPFGAVEQSLNERLIQMAGSLTAIRRGTLHIVHAWRLEGETLLRRGRVRQPTEYVDQLVEGSLLEAKANVTYLAERAETYGVPYELHLEKGRPTQVIPETIAAIRPGVVVLGTLARTGLRGMFIGNTAEAILGTVEASVLAAKPNNFVTPIPPD